MSRIGKKPILIPEGVEAKIEGQKVTVKGPKGEIVKEFRSEINISFQGNEVLVSPAPLDKKDDLRPSQKKQINALWGTTRAHVSNMIRGVKDGFENKLEIEGIGFKAAASGDLLELSVGFTHPVRLKPPEGVKFSIEKNVIAVSGTNLEKVSLFAAQIKRVRPPEPYKGKGIRYQGEIIRRKVGKKVVAATK